MRLATLPLAIPILVSLAVPAIPQSEIYVDLELVLAVDVSWSMDPREQMVQRQGYVDAFRHPAVLGAIADGAVGKIAVTYLEWAGYGRAETVVPWMMIDGRDSADAFAVALAAAPINHWRATSISNALSFASSRFEANGYSSERRVIDISGDGANNTGEPVAEARDRVVDRGIIINGLPVVVRDAPSHRFSRETLADLDIYYEDCVIGGPGSFVVTVENIGHFASAIRRKLVLEIAGTPLPVIPVVTTRSEPRIDCLIGEKRGP